MNREAIPPLVAQVIDRRAQWSRLYPADYIQRHFVLYDGELQALLDFAGSFAPTGQEREEAERAEFETWHEKRFGWKPLPRNLSMPYLGEVADRFSAWLAGRAALRQDAANDRELEARELTAKLQHALGITCLGSMALDEICSRIAALRASGKEGERG